MRTIGTKDAEAYTLNGVSILAQVKGVIITDDTNAQRPEGFASVEWQTPFEPTAAANGVEDGDTWIDTSGAMILDGSGNMILDQNESTIVQP